jgi:hypothetical protein
MIKKAADYFRLDEAGADKDKAAVDRTGIEGQPIPSPSRENNFVQPQPIEGSFWSL